MTVTQAFAGTTVALDKSMTQVEALLELHGVTEQRYTHSKPTKNDPDEAEGEGRIICEFVWPGKAGGERRGVRLVVTYRPTMWGRQSRYGARVHVKGVSSAQAGRALFWLLKAKFDAITFGIEEFEVAFMPHLVTALGFTFAERPQLIGEAMSEPKSVGTLALPAGVA